MISMHIRRPRSGSPAKEPSLVRTFETQPSPAEPPGRVFHGLQVDILDIERGQADRLQGARGHRLQGRCARRRKAVA